MECKKFSPEHKRRSLESREIRAVFETLCWYYNVLYCFMTQYVKALLATPSLAASFWPLEPTHWNATEEAKDEEDEAGNLGPEPNESPADGVYRYPEGAVAWQAAVHQLLQPHHTAVFETISVGVVYVSGFQKRCDIYQSRYSGLLKRYFSNLMCQRLFTAQFTQRRLTWDLYLTPFSMIMNVTEMLP